MPSLHAAHAYIPRSTQHSDVIAIVRRHLPAFLERIEEHGGALPAFVTDELEAFLTCGDFGQGFLELACQRCGEHLRVPFSCKGRAFCSSCIGRRMAEGAALLVDTVLPPVAYRQWVLSFEGSLAIRLGYDHDLLRRVCQSFAHRVMQSIRQRVKRHHDVPSVANLHPGLVIVVQRFRSDCGLYVHLHGLASDGAFLDDQGSARWLAAPPLHIRDLERLLSTVRRDLHDVTDANDELDIDSSLAACVQLSLLEPSPYPHHTSHPSPPPLLVSGDGIRIHAASTVDGRDKRRLERVCRYLLRPPFAQDAVVALPSGDVRLHMKRPNHHGSTFVDMHPHKFLARLVALVPPPAFHMVRYYGAFANRHHLRALIVPVPPQPLERAPKQLELFAVDTSNLPELSFFPSEEQLRRDARRLSWAKLLARVFDIDITICKHCHGKLKILGAVTHPDAIATKLHGSPARAPPPSSPDQPTLFPL